jgi:hypothetical protein
MLPTVVAHIGASDDQKKYSVALFVIGLGSEELAQELKPVLKEAVEEKVKQRLRHGLHALDEENE